MIWNRRDALWELGFEHLVRCLNDNGHRLPKVDAQGFRIRAWVNAQRNNRKLDQTRPRPSGRPRLTQERVARLEAVPGFTWDAHGDRWEAAFNRLIEYVNQYGDALVPQPYCCAPEAGETRGFKLGAWVNSQRGDHLKDLASPRATPRLSSERVTCLEAMPEWAWVLRGKGPVGQSHQ